MIYSCFAVELKRDGAAFSLFPRKQENSKDRLDVHVREINLLSQPISLLDSFHEAHGRSTDCHTAGPEEGIPKVKKHKLDRCSKHCQGNIFSSKQ